MADEKKILGKYASEEEAQKAFEDLQAKLKASEEDREKLERWKSLMGSEDSSSSSTSASDGYVPAEYENDPELDDEQKKRFKLVEDRAVSRTLKIVSSVLEKQEEARKAWDKFLKDNPDLEGAENFVQAEANALLKETNGKKIDTDAAMKEVAKRVREKIQKLSGKKKDEKTPHVASGSDNERVIVRPDEEENFPSQDEILTDHITEFRKRKAQQMRIDVK